MLAPLFHSPFLTTQISPFCLYFSFDFCEFLCLIVFAISLHAITFMNTNSFHNELIYTNVNYLSYFRENGTTFGNLRVKLGVFEVCAAATLLNCCSTSNKHCSCNGAILPFFPKCGFWISRWLNLNFSRYIIHVYTLCCKNLGSNFAR